jgi:hypothetical protein
LIDLGRSRAFQRSIVAIYWAAIPFLVLGAAGAAMLEGMPGHWGLAAGLAFGAGLLGWRLWLYRRALGVAGPAPPMRRLLLVWTPLGLLALVGAVMILIGLTWMSAPLWLRSQTAFWDAIDGSMFVLVAVVAGAVLIVTGALMTIPLFRALAKHRPVEIETVAGVFGDDPGTQAGPPA